MLPSEATYFLTLDLAASGIAEDDMTFCLRAVKEAGVAVTTRSFPGQFHGFFTMGKLLQQANVAAEEIGVWLKALN